LNFESYLERIANLNPALNAFLDLDAAAAGDGMTIGVKANIAVKGLPFHGGIGAYRERLAPADAACVAALRASGAVIMGILNMHEAGLGGSSDNPFFGPVRNPSWPGLSPGGSSGGGAAAVAAGLCEAALGTDTLGSVRIPAAYCGVFGHKPSQGLVSTQGVMPLSWTLDSVGVQAPTVDVCAAVMRLLAPLPPPRRLGVCAVLEVAGQVELHPDVAAALAAAGERAQAMGLAVQSLRLPEYDFAALRRAGLLIAEVEAEVTHRARLAECPEGFSPELRRLLAWGAAQPAAKVEAAYARISAAGAQVRAALAGVDVLILPTTPQPAFAFGQAPPADQADLTALANIAGLAATAFPAGVAADGAPVSLQAMSANDTMALRAAGMLSI